MSEYDDQNRPENGEVDPDQPQNDQQPQAGGPAENGRQEYDNGGQYYQGQYYQGPDGQWYQYGQGPYDQNGYGQNQQYYNNQGQYYQGPDGQWYQYGQGPYDQNGYGQNQQYYNNQGQYYQGPDGQWYQYGQGPYDQNQYGQNQQYGRNSNQWNQDSGQQPYWQNLAQNSEDEETQRQRNRYTNISLISAICGMLSLCCGSPFISILFGIIAVVTAILSRKGKPFTGKAMAGLILGIFAIGLGAVEWLYLMAFESLLEDPEFSSILNQMYEQMEQAQ